MNQDKLGRYLDAGFNVLLEGSHGLGKTAIIKEIFESRSLNWKYFSAATMDPWIDFIGVPKTVTKNGTDVLELVKQEEFANDQIEAIFFDEFNRAHPKVMNAVMELIQFKSINGKKFNNLKVVWAAINPYDEDGTYSVEQLDPATKDRFQIQIKMPLELNTAYLIKTHGEIARPFIKWWNELPKELKFQVSPRRLDYAIQVYSVSGDLRDTLISTSNVKKLETLIYEMNKGLEIEKLIKKPEKELYAFFNLENTIRYGEQVLSNKKYSYLVQYFHRDFVESNIQKKDGSTFNSLLIKEALNNEELYKNLTEKSQVIIDSVRKSGGIVKKVQIEYSMEKTITSVIQQSMNKSHKVFMTNLTTVFNNFCIGLSGKKSTDITAFFNLMFNVKDTHGLPLKENIIKKMEIFKTLNGYVPNLNNEKLFMGLLLNFTMKYAKESNISTKNLEMVINNIYKGYIDKKDAALGFVILGFDDSNWPILKEVIEKKPDWNSIANTLKIKGLWKDLNNKKEVKYRNPSSIDAAREIFAEKELTLSFSAVNKIKDLVYSNA